MIWTSHGTVLPIGMWTAHNEVGGIPAEEDSGLKQADSCIF